MEIIAYFNNGHEPTRFTVKSWDLLITDADVDFIISAETGEILFER